MSKIRYHSDPVVGAICATVFSMIWALMIAPGKTFRLILLAIAVVVSPFVNIIKRSIR